MPKTKTRTGRKPSVRRRAIPEDPHSFVTPAEARGEAAYMVLQIMLRQIPQSMCRRIMAGAYVEADTLDVAAITEEIECLFRTIPFEIPTR
ncbi:MAG: hypothetical protein QM773_00845 [Hyphomonadaceae bacterium]